MAGSSEPRTEQQVIARFNEMRQQVNSLVSKIADLEGESAEHELVIKALQPMDKARRCYRMIGDVLVERTVGEALPAVERNRDNLQQALASLKKQREETVKELAEFQVGAEVCLERAGARQKGAHVCVPAAGGCGVDASTASRQAGLAPDLHSLGLMRHWLLQARYKIRVQGQDEQDEGAPSSSKPKQAGGASSSKAQGVLVS